MERVAGALLVLSCVSSASVAGAFRTALPPGAAAAAFARRAAPALRSRAPWPLQRTAVRGFAAVGDRFPAVKVDYGFPPTEVDLGARLAGKKTVVVGLPGAFTPVWSAQQVPGYLAKQAELKAKGVDEVLVFCVNDGAVMEAWAKDQGVEGSMITFLADTRSELTEALDLVLHAEVLGNPRCKRFAIVVEDGVIKAIKVADGDVPDEATFVEAMLEEM